MKQLLANFLSKLLTILHSLISKFTVLIGAVRELWVVFGAKLLTILAYQVMNLTLVLWLSSDLGFSDKRASSTVAVWSGLMTLFTILVGSLVDAIGLRKALLLGIGICFFSRGMLTFATPSWLALGCGLLPLALGEALLTPVMVAAIRRYTTTAQRSIAFSIFYALMNAGFGIAAFLFDFLRKSLGEHGQFTLPGLGLQLSTYRLLFLVSFVLTLPNLVLIYFALRDGVEVTDDGVRINVAVRPQSAGAGLGRTLLLHVQTILRDTVRIFTGLWRQPAFHKFLAFLGLVVAVRLIFYHMYYTYPKFGIRELGEGAPIGRLWAVNSLAILILAPLAGALTQKIPAYKMVVIGSFISAASVFLMAMPPAWFQPLADGRLGFWLAHSWLGFKEVVHPFPPYYVMIFIYVLLLSVGEALWSPRLYEYTAAIAPKGQEASYMSLSFLPYFVAKFFVGLSSGFLLDRYCPEHGPRHSQTLWFIIALTTMITPVGLLIFRRYIRVHEAGRP